MKNQIPINIEYQMDALGYYEEYPIEEPMTATERIYDFWDDKLYKVKTIDIIDFIVEKTTFLESL